VTDQGCDQVRAKWLRRRRWLDGQSDTISSLQRAKLEQLQHLVTEVAEAEAVHDCSLAQFRYDRVAKPAAAGMSKPDVPPNFAVNMDGSQPANSATVGLHGLMRVGGFQQWQASSPPPATTQSVETSIEQTIQTLQSLRDRSTTQAAVAAKPSSAPNMNLFSLTRLPKSSSSAALEPRGGSVTTVVSSAPVGVSATPVRAVLGHDTTDDGRLDALDTNPSQLRINARTASRAAPAACPNAAGVAASGDRLHDIVGQSLERFQALLHAPPSSPQPATADVAMAADRAWTKGDKAHRYVEDAMSAVRAEMENEKAYRYVDPIRQVSAPTMRGWNSRIVPQRSQGPSISAGQRENLEAVHHWLWENPHRATSGDYDRARSSHN
jgi:hypothetical protein